MQTNLNIILPRLMDADEFEALLRDICALEWGDPDAQRFGRKGQKQYGVDVYGKLKELQGTYRGVQCKLRTTNSQISETEMEKEVGDAKQFPHQLDKLIIATDAPRDTSTQILVDNISELEIRNGGFRVIIWFWDDITERLAAYPKLLIKYYKSLFKDLTSLPLFERLVELPLHVVVNAYKTTEKWLRVEESLRFRGVQVLNLKGSSANWQTHISGSDLEDGVIFYFDADANDDYERLLIAYVRDLQNQSQQQRIYCPIFAILPAEFIERVIELAKDFLLDLQHITLIEIEHSPNEIADNIFGIIFPYGYRRRGALSTIELLARTRISQASGVLLDIDWQSKLSTEVFPSTDEWKDYFVPALDSIRSQVLSYAEFPRIQFNSQLPIPAAIALGYYFNLRLAKVGVWARALATSDFKRQFWLSDSSAARINLQPDWIQQEDDHNHSAILELSTYVSIHESVQAYTVSSGLQVKKWARLTLEIDGHPLESIEERSAVAFANHVGQFVRQLNSKGVTDIHLFARIPSALAVLVGQRLYACGRIHLYWFENPSYRYAFVLS